jgi:hypothetical protein
MINILIVVLATLLYVKGQCETKWLGKPHKNWKLTLGIPVGILGSIVVGSFIPLLCLGTYAIAGSMGYGDNNWLTKLVGKRNAITICGALLGLASIPLLGFLGVIQGIVAAAAFYYIAELDDSGIIKEPFVAIGRASLSTILILLAK